MGINYPIKKITKELLLILFVVFFTSSQGFSYVMKFLPSATITEEYDDNINRSEVAEYDFITIVSPSFLFDINTKQSGITLTYMPSYSYYANYSANDTLRQNLVLNAFNAISRKTKVQFSNSFNRTEEPIQQNIEESAQYEIRQGRSPYKSNNAHISLVNQFGASDNMHIAYNNSLTDYEDSDLNDYMTHEPSLGLTYQFNTQTIFQSDVSYIKGVYKNYDSYEWKGKTSIQRKFTHFFNAFIQYAHTIIEYEGNTNSENYQTLDPSIGIEYSYSEDTHVSIALGYLMQDRRLSEDESEVSIDSNITKTIPFKRGAFSLKASSGYNESYGTENLGLHMFYLSQGGVQYKLSPHLNLNLSGGYQYHRYLDQAPERKDYIKTARIHLDYQISKSTNLQLAYTHAATDSTINNMDSDRNQVMLKLSVSPTLPMRLSE